MKDDPKTLEELADEILLEDAKNNKTTLFREGIIDERRQRAINKREIPLSAWLKDRQERR